MSLNSFAIVGPPADKKHLLDILEYYKQSRPVFHSEKTLLKLIEWTPSFKGTDFGTVKSKADVEVSGFNVVCTVLPEMVDTIAEETDLKQLASGKVWEACRVAAAHDCGIAALGGFSSISVVGEEEDISNETGIAVTSGNTYTAWLTAKGIETAASLLGADLSRATMTVIGASGDIGRGLCAVFSRKVKKLILFARRRDRLEKFRDELRKNASATLEIAPDVESAVRASHIMATTAISHRPIVTEEHVSPGMIICDVGYPKNVSGELAARDDMFVFEGGLARLPFSLDFGFKSILPAPDVLWGCTAEAVILALEHRFENYSTGRGNISVEKMFDIGKAGEKHGFGPALFYSGHRLLDAEDIENVKKHIDPDISVRSAKKKTR